MSYRICPQNPGHKNVSLENHVLSLILLFIITIQHKVGYTISRQKSNLAAGGFRISAPGLAVQCGMWQAEENLLNMADSPCGTPLPTMNLMNNCG
jgi:hypothetical protein